MSEEEFKGCPIVDPLQQILDKLDYLYQKLESIESLLNEMDEHKK